MLQFEGGTIAARHTFDAAMPIRSSVLPTFNGSLDEILGSFEPSAPFSSNAAQPRER